MSRYPEFERNLTGIARTIDSLRTAIEGVGSLSEDEKKATTDAMTTLEEIHTRWKQNADFHALHPDAKFSMPMDWDNDKQSRYDATMRIQEILGKRTATH